jgi:hypothetical protein
MMADRAIQHDMPIIRPAMTPEWLLALARAISAAWPVLRVMLWIGLGALVLWILWLIARRFLTFGALRRRAEPTQDEEAEWRPDAAPARALLTEADALAAAGHYGEAARLILKRSVEDIARRRPALVRPATTSRDLVAAPELPATARPAFALIARVVEISLFADRGAGAEAWADARAAYADFALAGNWR